MLINFTQLFQDSWNFIRNRRQYTLTFVILFSALSFAINLLSAALIDSVPVISNAEQMTDTEFASAILENVGARKLLSIYLINQLFFLLISCWGILTAHHISRQDNYGLVETLILTLRRFAGVLALNILIVLPLLFALANTMAAVLQQVSPSVIILAVMVLAIFVFIRLCLAPISYLTGAKGLTESLTFIWQKGIKRTINLLIYCLIVYFVFQLINHKLATLAGNPLLMVIVTLIMAFISTFSLVLTYRFYSMFTQKV